MILFFLIVRGPTCISSLSICCFFCERFIFFCHPEQTKPRMGDTDSSREFGLFFSIHAKLAVLGRCVESSPFFSFPSVLLASPRLAASDSGTRLLSIRYVCHPRVYTSLHLIIIGVSLLFLHCFFLLPLCF